MVVVLCSVVALFQVSACRCQVVVRIPVFGHRVAVPWKDADLWTVPDRSRVGRPTDVVRWKVDYQMVSDW